MWLHTRQDIRKLDKHSEKKRDDNHLTKTIHDFFLKSMKVARNGHFQDNKCIFIQCLLHYQMCSEIIFKER